MLGRTTRPPVIGKVENSGHRGIFSEEITSPKSPLDFKIRSPRGMKNCVVGGGGGVGLGIVAALEKSGGGGGEIPMRFIVGNLNLNLNKSSIPIPIGSNNKTSTKCREVLLEESESYTYVTCHGPNKSFTRVYCDGGECKDVGDFDRKLRNLSVFYESPPRFTESKLEYPTSDFLSSCYLCRKNLHGKDIFMYRGEKAFCSAECRHTQIVKDERKEKCQSEASRYGDGISMSPYTGGSQLYSTGIFAS